MQGRSRWHAGPPGTTGHEDGGTSALRQQGVRYSLPEASHHHARETPLLLG